VLTLPSLEVGNPTFASTLSAYAGTTVVSGAPASLCFWADDATFGSVTVLEPSSPESAADTATAVRAAVVG